MARRFLSFWGAIAGGIGLSLFTYHLLKLTDFFWDEFSAVIFVYVSFPVGCVLGYTEISSAILEKQRRKQEAGNVRLIGGWLAASYILIWLSGIGIVEIVSDFIFWFITFGIPLLLAARCVVIGLRLSRSGK